MEALESKYIPLDYSELPTGINIIEAHQGAGKTERIKDLNGSSTIVVGARRELGDSLLTRCKEMDFAHYERISDNEELQTRKNLFICYPSLHRLNGKDWTRHTWDNLVIDEVGLVFSSSFKWLPDHSNNEIFHKLINRTKRQLLVGAYIPKYVLSQIEKIKPQLQMTIT